MWISIWFTAQRHPPLSAALASCQHSLPLHKNVQTSKGPTESLCTNGYVQFKPLLCNYCSCFVTFNRWLPASVEMSRKPEQGLLTLIVVLTTWTVHPVATDGRLLQDSQSARHGKMVERGFTSGSHLIEVLAWAVEIEEMGADISPAMKGEAVAKDCQLLNSGALESAQNWFLMSHDLHDDIVGHIGHVVKVLPDLNHIARQRHSLPVVMSMANSTTASGPLGLLQEKLQERFTTASELDSVQYEITKCLNAHQFVRSFVQEVVHPRQKRQIQFPDPKFGQQWHLVSDYKFIVVSAANPQKHCCNVWKTAFWDLQIFNWENWNNINLKLENLVFVYKSRRIYVTLREKAQRNLTSKTEELPLQSIQQDFFLRGWLSLADSSVGEIKSLSET